jgi:hypothetical protein
MLDTLLTDGLESTEPMEWWAADGAASLAELAASDPTELSDESLVTMAATLERARRFLDASSAHALAELHRRDATDRLLGVRTSTWLAREAGIGLGAARRRVRVACAVVEALPEVDQALTNGRIGVQHAEVMAEATNERNGPAMAGAAGERCAAAATTTFAHWRRDTIALGELLDADGGHDPADDVERNHLRISPSTSFSLVRGELHGDLASTLHQAVEDMADELFRQYTRDAGLDPSLVVPRRATLRALALVELCRRGTATDLAGTAPSRPEVALVLNAADPRLLSDAQGHLVDALGHQHLLCDPVLRAIVIGLDGLPEGAGHAGRLATPEQRRALAHRDGGCVFPGCTAPPSWTDAHHVRHWTDHGPTELENLASLCRRHHRVSHRDGWEMHITDDQWCWWRTPSGVTFWSQRHQRRRAGPPPG